MYGFDAAIGYIGMPDTAEKMLEQISKDLVGTNDLIAIYIPEGTEDHWQPGAMRGKVVGAVRLLPMPSTSNIRDYHYDDWDGHRRWPIGWPCAAVFAPPIDECPMLRSLVEVAHGANAFQPYVARFQHGPFPLDAKIAAALVKCFSIFQPIDMP